MSVYTPVSLRKQVLANAGAYCAYCHSAEELMAVTFEIEHIIPRSAGGQTSETNLCLSCPTCNRHKSNRLTVKDRWRNRRGRAVNGFGNGFNGFKRVWESWKGARLTANLTRCVTRISDHDSWWY